jgi:hypothetical protein
MVDVDGVKCGGVAADHSGARATQRTEHEAMSSCTKHQSEHAVGSCRRCADEWCTACLVYTYGPDKPPYCVSCAMVAAGVRTSGARPAVTRRQLKAQAKAQRKAEKLAAKAATNGPSGDDQGSNGGDGEGSGGSGIDWSSPWWEKDDERIAVD